MVAWVITVLRGNQETQTRLINKGHLLEKESTLSNGQKQTQRISKKMKKQGSIFQIKKTKKKNSQEPTFMKQKLNDWLNKQFKIFINT